MKRDLFKNTFIIAIGKFSTQVLSYFLLPLYTSILSTSDYGIYDLLVTICIFVIPLITILMEESMFRFLIDETEEVGKKKGSWKGGCIGCSYDLKPGETPEECLKRMEKEREF